MKTILFFSILLCIITMPVLGELTVEDLEKIEKKNHTSEDQKIGEYRYSFILPEQKRTLAQEDSIAFQSVTREYALNINSQSDFSYIGASISLHRDIGTQVPFFGALGYHRQIIPFVYAERRYKVNLGFLGSIEYAKTAWADDFFGLKPPFAGQIIRLGAMIGTDVQIQSGSLIAAGGLTFHKIAHGDDAKLFGAEAVGRGEYNVGVLAAYIMHFGYGGSRNDGAALYVRYHKKRIIVGLTLGIVVFN